MSSQIRDLNVIEVHVSGEGFCHRVVSYAITPEISVLVEAGYKYMLMK